MKTLFTRMLLACLLNSSIISSIQASDAYSEIYYNGTIRCYGDIIQDDNMTHCYTRYNTSNESTSSVTDIGLIVFSTVLAAYIVQPSWDYFFKPQLIKIKDKASPYVQGIYEYMHSKCFCCTERIPFTKHSSANMDDINNVFRASLPMNLVTDLQRIDKILIELDWKKKPIVFSFNEESSMEDQEKIERLIGYTYTGFASSGYKISLISGWSDKDIGKNNYHLNPIHKNSYDILESKVKFHLEDLIETNFSKSKKDDRKQTIIEKNDKPEKKNSLLIESDSSNAENDIKGIKKQSKAEKKILPLNKKNKGQLNLVDLEDILKNMDSRLASILTNFVTNVEFDRYDVYNSLYIVFPKMDESDLNRAYIKLEKIKF